MDVYSLASLGWEGSENAGKSADAVGFLLSRDYLRCLVHGMGD